MKDDKNLKNEEEKEKEKKLDGKKEQEEKEKENGGKKDKPEEKDENKKDLKEEKTLKEKKDEEDFQPNFDFEKLNGNNKKIGPKNLVLLIMAIVLVLMLTMVFNNGSFGTEETLTYTQMIENIKGNEIRTITEKSGYLHYEMSQVIVGTESPTVVKKKTKMISTRLEDDENLIKLLNENNVTIGSEEAESMPYILQVLVGWFPMILLIVIWVFMLKQMNKGGGGGPTQIFNMGKSKTKTGEGQIKVTFDDVAGVVEAKEELKEVIDFLKEPEKFANIGARIPKGVLLLGDPGTGKTLLAKAVAGEAKVPFFSISGSEFVEMFVGVGASRVRDLFNKARKNSPCIVFIDEIDAVGRKRGSGHGGGNDEREQTLNQLLVEMDGFGTDENIIIIAATNRADVLDKALTRPGRFDRQIIVDAPDIKGREAIMTVHAKGKKFADDVDFKIIAKKTPGSVGADLANLLNEAALLAARYNREVITMSDLEEASEKIAMGPERRSRIMPEHEKINTAYHEIGHALVRWLLPEMDPVHKITIIPRGKSLGSTWHLPQEDKYSHTKTELLNDIKSALGGRAAEEIKFKDITTGATSDIQYVTSTVYNMVTRYGMSEIIGPLNLGKWDDGSITGLTNYGDETAKKIDNEIHKIVNEAYEETKKLILDNLDIFESLSLELLEKETLTGDEMEEVIKKTRELKA